MDSNYLTNHSGGSGGGPGGPRRGGGGSGAPRRGGGGPGGPNRGGGGIGATVRSMAAKLDNATKFGGKNAKQVRNRRIAAALGIPVAAAAAMAAASGIGAAAVLGGRGGAAAAQKFGGTVSRAAAARLGPGSGGAAARLLGPGGGGGGGAAAAGRFSRFAGAARGAAGRVAGAVRGAAGTAASRKAAARNAGAFAGRAVRGANNARKAFYGKVDGNGSTASRIGRRLAFSFGTSLAGNLAKAAIDKRRAGPAKAGGGKKAAAPARAKKGKKMTSRERTNRRLKGLAAAGAVTAGAGALAYRAARNYQKAGGMFLAMTIQKDYLNNHSGGSGGGPGGPRRGGGGSGAPRRGGAGPGAPQRSIQPVSALAARIRGAAGRAGRAAVGAARGVVGAGPAKGFATQAARALFRGTPVGMAVNAGQRAVAGAREYKRVRAAGGNRRKAISSAMLSQGSRGVNNGQLGLGMFGVSKARAALRARAARRRQARALATAKAVPEALSSPGRGPFVRQW